MPLLIDGEIQSLSVALFHSKEINELYEMFEAKNMVSEKSSTSRSYVR